MTIKEIKSTILKKGWAGKTISREETVQKLNPLIEAHVALNHAYTSLLPLLTSEDVKQELAAILKTARLDIGKVMEVVFSCGGTAYNGTTVEPESFALSRDDALTELRKQEEAFRDLLLAERPVEHQIRTEAVLTRLLTNSDIRLSFIRTCVRHASVPA